MDSQKRYKYGRTYHLPFSMGVQSDDKYLNDFSLFEGKEIQVSVKMDGENTTMYWDYSSHARSLDSRTNWTRDIVRSKLAEIGHLIPKNYRICCENLYATHSIEYPDGFLDGYIYLLSVWNGDNVALSLDDTKKVAELLGLPMPRELYRGVYNLEVLEKIAEEIDLEVNEGFVIRLTSEIQYEDFSRSVAKFVRPGHVQDSSEHWLKKAKKNGTPKKR